jgi:hypothetical protein
MLTLLLRLHQEGIALLHTEWFWYETDWCRDDPQKAHSFFVVHENKIVRDRAVIFEDLGGDRGFDPSVFRTDDGEPIWNREREWDEAKTRFLYRKFFAETYKGQLFVLHKDSQPWVAKVLDPASQNLKMAEDIQRVQKSLSTLCWIGGGILVGIVLILVHFWT